MSALTDVENSYGHSPFDESYGDDKNMAMSRPSLPDKNAQFDDSNSKLR